MNRLREVVIGTPINESKNYHISRQPILGGGFALHGLMRNAEARRSLRGYFTVNSTGSVEPRPDYRGEGSFPARLKFSVVGQR